MIGKLYGIPGEMIVNVHTGEISTVHHVRGSHVTIGIGFATYPVSDWRSLWDGRLWRKMADATVV